MARPRATLARGRETKLEYIKGLFSSLSSGDGWGEGGSSMSLRLANGALDQRTHGLAGNMPCVALPRPLPGAREAGYQLDTQRHLSGGTR